MKQLSIILLVIMVGCGTRVNKIDCQAYQNFLKANNLYSFDRWGSHFETFIINNNPFLVYIKRDSLGGYGPQYPGHGGGTGTNIIYKEIPKDKVSLYKPDSNYNYSFQSLIDDGTFDALEPLNIGPFLRDPADSLICEDSVEFAFPIGPFFKDTTGMDPLFILPPTIKGDIPFKSYKGRFRYEDLYNKYYVENDTSGANSWDARMDDFKRDNNIKIDRYFRGGTWTDTLTPKKDTFQFYKWPEKSAQWILDPENEELEVLLTDPPQYRAYNWKTGKRRPISNRLFDDYKNSLEKVIIDTIFIDSKGKPLPKRNRVINL